MWNIYILSLKCKFKIKISKMDRYFKFQMTKYKGNLVLMVDIMKDIPYYNGAMVDYCIQTYKSYLEKYERFSVIVDATKAPFRVNLALLAVEKIQDAIKLNTLAMAKVKACAIILNNKEAIALAQTLQQQYPPVVKQILVPDAMSARNFILSNL